MTVDIAALREVLIAGLSEVSHLTKGACVLLSDDLARSMLEVLSQLEVISSSEWKLAGELVVVQKQLEAAQVRIAELENVQEPDHYRYSCCSCGYESLECSSKCPACNYHKIEKESLYTAPPKPVIKLPRTLWYEHDDLPREIPVLEKKKVIARLKAAGIGVKDSK